MGSLTGGAAGEHFARSVATGSAVRSRCSNLANAVNGALSLAASRWARSRWLARLNSACSRWTAPFPFASADFLTWLLFDPRSRHPTTYSVTFTALFNETAAMIWPNYCCVHCHFGRAPTAAAWSTSCYCRARVAQSESSGPSDY